MFANTANTSTTIKKAAKGICALSIKLQFTSLMGAENSPKFLRKPEPFPSRPSMKLSQLWLERDGILEKDI